MSVRDARRYLAEGQFPAGSMGPKIEAACRFSKGAAVAVPITDIDRLHDALEGKTGTWICA